MYPLDFPLRVLEKFGKRGDWVIDPFCGRGTTNFAARLRRMPSIGVDSSRVATALAQAKLATATPNGVVESAKRILKDAKPPTSMPTGEFWKLAYHEHTLVQLCQLREALLAQCSSDTRILLRAIMLGALHGPKPKGTPSYFSNQSPRTFAPKPKYAVKFWTERNMHPVEVDVLSIIKARAKRYLTEPPPSIAGKVLLGDSRVADTFADLPKKARLVVTSPPYFGMRTYLPDQWLRLWFLGGPDYVEYRQPEGQLEHSGADHFAAEMGRVWTNVANHTTDDARLIIRYGGIHDRDAVPLDVLKKSLVESGWKMKTAQAVPAPVAARRQVVQFGAEPKEAKTEYDVYCHRA
ncbi:MAG: hypothetical protein KF901_01110 [Myxococcales bacterium]|nr:hypothetical protein [Myxococcales bacterium]